MQYNERRELKIRLATENDVNLIYHWRNDPSTRKYFFDDSEIEKSNHEKWYLESLVIPSRHILIAEYIECPVGVVRFDVKGNIAEVDIYTSPGSRQQGAGTIVLEAAINWVKKNLKNVEKVVAKVKPQNVPSLRVFEKNNFKHDYIALGLNIND